MLYAADALISSYDLKYTYKYYNCSFEKLQFNILIKIVRTPSPILFFVYLLYIFSLL